MSRPHDQRGQASIELLATLPLLLGALALIAQLAIAGYALWSAGGAARAASRAQLVGGDPERAARSALPGWLEQGAAVSVGDAIRVRLRAPALLPGVPAIPISARAALDPGVAP